MILTAETSHSTNGHIPVKHHESTVDVDAEVVAPTGRGVRRFVMPVLLAATALIILRRMQRGSVV